MLMLGIVFEIWKSNRCGGKKERKNWKATFASKCKQKSHHFVQCLLSKLQYIHPIFKCSDLATHITQSTRSTQRAQTSLAEADHYSHMPTVKILRLGGERLTHPPPPPPLKKKKKKKKFWIITCTTIWLCYSHYGVVCSFFCSFILLIYSSQKVPRSLKFCTALHILVLHMHRKFDVDSIDSF